MGADLYIPTLFKKQKAKYEPLFNEWVKIRDGLQDGTGIQAEAQEKVDRYYGLMYANGYFRDSYNNWNLLWQFDFDYWVKFKLYMNKKQMITPEKAKKLLAELKRREPIFEKNMQDLRNRRNRVWDYRSHSKRGYKELVRPLLDPDKELNRQDAENYYRKHYRELQDFLQKAIDFDVSIECSI